MEEYEGDGGRGIGQAEKCGKRPRSTNLYDWC